MSTVPTINLVGPQRCYQSDRLRWVITLNRDTTGMTARFVAKKSRSAADSAAIVDTGAGKGTLNVLDHSIGKWELIVGKPHSVDLVDKVEVEFFLVNGGDPFTEFEGTVEFKRRVLHAA